MKQATEQISRLRKLSKFLDSEFDGPMGFRFGWDGIFGLIPFVGDLVTNLLSLFILSQALVLGASPYVLGRMAINLAIENLFDMVPIVGNIFDFFWKANEKNMDLLERHLQDARSTSLNSKFFLILIVVALLSFLVLSALVTYFTIKWVYIWLMQS